MIYMDNAATTRISDEVIAEMIPYLKEEYGNPGSRHRMGREAKKAVDKARERVAEFLYCEPDNIIFTSGGSEANNMVFNSLGENRELFRKFVMVSPIEHESVMKACDAAAEREYGIVSLPLKKGTGHIDIEEARRRMDKMDGRIRLVSCMYANNETGIFNDVWQLGTIANAHNVPFHTDCVQAAGNRELKVDQIGCDFLSISSHKIHGPKGVGALYVRNRKCLTPTIYGGEEQEFGLRGGTENVAGIVGFGKACQIAGRGIEERRKRYEAMRMTFYSEFASLAGSSGIDFAFHDDVKSLDSKVISIHINDVDSETLVLALDSMGICISSGSACNGHSVKPSRVIMEMGHDEMYARETVRLSMSDETTIGEVITTARSMVKACAMLKEIGS